MKTVTEFAGVSLRSVLTLRQKLWNEQKAAFKDKKQEASPAAPDAATEPTETPVTETAAPSEAPEAPVSEPSAPPKARSIHEQVEERVREELSKYLSETMKLEGEKLQWMLEALSLVDSRRMADLRRVVVYKLLEGEKAPGNVVQKGEAYFMAEYLAPVGGARARDRSADRKREGKGKGKGRDPRRKGRSTERGARSFDRSSAPGSADGIAARGDARAPKSPPKSTPRPPRAPRPPREPRAPRPPLPTGVAPITVQTSGIPAKKLSMPVPKSQNEPKTDTADPSTNPQG
jgi:hypothetical protein